MHYTKYKLVKTFREINVILFGSLSTLHLFSLVRSEDLLRKGYSTLAERNSEETKGGDNEWLKNYL